MSDFLWNMMDIILLPLVMTLLVHAVVKKTLVLDKEYPLMMLFFLLCNASWWVINILINYSDRVSYSSYMNLLDDVTVDIVIAVALVIIGKKRVGKKQGDEIDYNKSKQWGTLVAFSLMMFLYFVSKWFTSNFSYATVESILYTIAAPAKGTADVMIWNAVGTIAIPFVWVAIVVFAFVVLRRKKTEYAFFCGRSRKFGTYLSTILLIMFVAVLVWRSGIVEYIANMDEMSNIYENYYVDPKDTNISGEKKRNLILVFLESMETTYADKDNGGIQTINYIPKLTDMAYDNISFSNLESGLGGFVSCKGTDWTMGATIGVTSGINFEFLEDKHTLNNRESIAKNATFLGDLLEQWGYNNEVLMGSNGEYAGEGDYFVQHGNYKVFDLNSMYTERYVEEGFKEWWGVRDEIVYKVAKNELINLSSDSTPFSFVMFTLDTHCYGGYVCPRCKNTYDTDLKNVLECADNQIFDFIEWCKAQDFYDNTTIVIIGDHPRMDSLLIGGKDIYERKVYNCIINSEKKTDNTSERVFTSLDMFPTILSSMGYDIAGDRLGLGTDLFSDTKTMAEEFGIDWVNDELSKKSQYYMLHFY